MTRITFEGRDFLICPRCGEQFDPWEVMGEEASSIPTYCKNCNIERIEQKRFEGTIALITTRKGKFDRTSFNMFTKKKYNKIVEAGGKVFVMLDPTGELDGEVFDWEDLHGAPVYPSMDAWIDAMVAEGRKPEFGMKKGTK